MQLNPVSALQISAAFLLLLTATPVQAQSCDMGTPVCVETSAGSEAGLSFGSVCTKWSAVADCEPDNPIDTCEPFRSVSEPYTGSRPPLNGMCYETGKTCVLYSDGECLRHELNYRCWNGPVTAPPAILLSRKYENFSEDIQDSCVPLDDDPECTFNQYSIVEGQETRDINTLDLNRAWWVRNGQYTCVNASYDDTCGPFDGNPSCTFTDETTCLAYRDDGTCEYAEYVVNCDEDPSFDANCEPINACVGEECLEIEQEASADFPKASVWLNFLDRAAKDNDCEADPNLAPGEEPDYSQCNSQFAQNCEPEHSDWNITTDNPGPLVCEDAIFPHGQPEVFSGKGSNCRYNDILNCCNSGGFDGCKTREFDLRSYRQAGAAHYLGSACRTKNLLGWCIESRRYYCVYNSKFARVFQEQANLQTGDRFYMGLGSSPDIQCPGLTIAQMETLDVSIMDFSEVFGDMLDQADLPVEELLIERMEDQMGLVRVEVETNFE